MRRTSHEQTDPSAGRLPRPAHGFLGQHFWFQPGRLGFGFQLADLHDLLARRHAGHQQVFVALRHLGHSGGRLHVVVHGLQIVERQCGINVVLRTEKK